MTEKLIESISIAQIHIANPRARNRPRWQMMVANIREVGLKKPITVAQRSTASQNGKLYDLVCGQGRIEALMALGKTYIPAIVIDAPKEDEFLMSLVENIARRRPSNRDILREVKSLRDRGYTVGEIAKKFRMERMYVSGIVHLVEHEEAALIASVEAGKLPISVAVEIANGKDKEISAALSACCLDGLLDSGSNLQRRGTGRRRRFESGGLFAALPEKTIIDWCEKKRSSRYVLMASVIDAICEADNGDCSWQPLALSLLAKAPNKPKLLAAYFRQFRPMTWSGSRASLMERRLRLFGELLSNPNLHKHYGFIQSERDNFALDIERDRLLDRKLSAQSAATFE